jgi:tetratricopeptide (TPR) repeat protein
MALDAGRRRLPGSVEALAAIATDSTQPPVVRGSALALLDGRGEPAALDALRRALADPEPLVRLGALEGARGLEPGRRLALVRPLLDDPRLALRNEAARALADVPAAAWRPADRARLVAVLAETRATLALDADRPEAHVTLGLLAVAEGDPGAARRSYQRALALAPWFVPAYVNLADLERALGRDEAAEPWLRRAVEVAPELAEPHHALGLWLIRARRLGEAESELARAAALAPGSARFALVHALAVEANGDSARGLTLLRAALAAHPGEPELSAAVAEREAQPAAGRR